jgi:outer membrane biosynthesis protein TonB
MANEKAMRAAATELSTVLNLDPAINAKAKLSILTKEVEEAIGLINPAEGDSPDSFSEATLAVIREINPDIFPEEEEEEEVEEVKPAKRSAKKVVVEEPEEEEEEEEEVKPVKKPVAKKPAPVVEEEEEEEEEVKPVKKGAAAASPAGKKPTPFVKSAFTRGDAICEVLKTTKVKTKDDLIAKADALFVKKGGSSNIKETRFASKYILPALEKFDIEVPEK